LELPYLTGKSAYPLADPTAPGFMAFLCRLFARMGPFDLGDRVQPFQFGQDVPGLAGWEWHHTPGHAPGHVSFYRASDGTLLVGDAFTTVNLDSLLAIATKRQQISRPPTPITFDWDAARESVQRLAALKPFTFACGHGTPMSGNQAVLDFAEFARNFPVPSHGRYVAEPARTDASGVTYLPPKPPDPVPGIAASVGVAAIAGTMIAVAAKRRKGRPSAELTPREAS
jgi:glyoxylase-like metal-dependent hydrolase (beta-lactamase superfamily II)